MPGAVIEGRKIRLALVGCGRVASQHLQACASHERDIDLVGVCDVDADILRTIKAHTRAPTFGSLDAMLDQTRPDLVVLATPSALHPEQAVAAAAAGAHVMTEKPMATRWSDAQAMVAALEAAGKHLFVVKQLRYSPAFELLKQAIEARRFGRIHMVNVTVFWTRPQEYYDSAAWRGTWEFDGGALMNQASHYVDLLTWLIGPVESVHAFAAPLSRNIEVEDTAVLNLRWRTGALGSMSVTMLAYPQNFEASLTILGEHGTVRLGGPSGDRIDHWEFADAADHHSADAESLARVREHAPATKRSGHSLYYQNVIDVLRGQARPHTDGREGLRSLELIIAAYRSVREDRRVALPLEL